MGVFCQIYQNYMKDVTINLSSKELLQRDKFITIQKNLPHLTIEIYKVKMGISPVIMKDLSIQ